ncbi:MAG TPA: hypothetical protein VGL53_12775 [Bryobacteraceae bacterium]
MACPFFIPADPWNESDDPWPGPRRVPLGEPYRGGCSRTPLPIDPRDQAGVCNFGYARGRCSHFPPSESTPDAIRFSISGSDSLGHIDLIWITEIEHAPAAFGLTRWVDGSFEPDVPAAYRILARAFLESYLKGKCPQGITP